MSFSQPGSPRKGSIAALIDHTTSPLTPSNSTVFRDSFEQEEIHTQVNLHPRNLHLRARSSVYASSIWTPNDGSSLQGIELIPEYILLQLLKITCTGRNERTMIRFKLQNNSQNTPTAKNLVDHTLHLFNFPTSVHNMAFDTIKVDLFDVKGFGNTHKARAYIHLKELQKLVRDKYAINIVDSLNMNNPTTTTTTTTTTSTNPELSCSQEFNHFDTATFGQEHDDSFEINIPLFKPGSYSRLGSSLHRSSLMNIKSSPDLTRVDTQETIGLDYDPNSTFNSIEIGKITVKVTLHFKSQEPSLSRDDSRNSRESRESTSTIGIRSTRSSSSMNRSQTSETVHSNDSSDSVGSDDSSTLGRNHPGENILRYGSTLPIEGYPLLDQTLNLSSQLERQYLVDDELYESLLETKFTPPVSPYTPMGHQSPETEVRLRPTDTSTNDALHPQWRLSDWDEWKYTDGFDDGEDAPDILSYVNSNDQQNEITKSKSLKDQQEKEDAELMAEIMTNSEKSKNVKDLKQSSSSTSSKGVLGLLGIFSQQTRSAFKDIMLMYSSFFGHGWNLSSVEFVRGLQIVEQYHSLNPTPITNKTFTDIETLERSRHFIRLAMASYGSLSWVYFGYSFKVAPLNFIRFNSDRKNVMDYFKLKKEDMVVWHFDKRTALVPSYYIIRDPKYNALCIVMRGTFSIADAMTDLVCEYYPYKGGLVHKGIMDTARFVLQRSGKDIEEALKKFGLSTIYCIGHSLGAGSASLLCSLLQDHFMDYSVLTSDTLTMKSIDVKAYLFAPPPVCTANLAKEWKDSQIGFINENDFVCRLSYGNAINLKEMIKLGALESINPIYEGLSSKEKSERIMQVMDKAHESLCKSVDIPKLVIGGKVVYMYKHREQKEHKESPQSSPSTKRYSSPLSPSQLKTRISQETFAAHDRRSSVDSRISGSSRRESIVGSNTTPPIIRTRTSSLPHSRLSNELKQIGANETTKTSFDGAKTLPADVLNARLRAVQSKESLLRKSSESDKESVAATEKSTSASASTSTSCVSKGSKKEKIIKIEYSDRDFFSAIPVKGNWLWHHFPQQYDSKIERALTWVKAQQQQQQQQ